MRWMLQFSSQVELSAERGAVEPCSERAVLRYLLCHSFGLLWCCSQPVLNSQVLSRDDSCALACSGCASQALLTSAQTSVELE